MQKLNKQKVEFGYFQSQGLHGPSELHYTELMRIHEYGTGMGMAREVFGAAYEQSYTLLGQMRGKHFKGLLGGYVCRFIKEDSFDAAKLLDYVGLWAVHESAEIFGDPILGVTYNPTPLIDTGELSENFAWKVSLQGIVRTL